MAPAQKHSHLFVGVATFEVLPNETLLTSSAEITLVKVDSLFVKYPRSSYSIVYKYTQNTRAEPCFPCPIATRAHVS